MSFDFLAAALPSVQQLSPYVPGKPVEELARELSLNPEDIVKLASNENPLGPSASVCAAIADVLNRVRQPFNVNSLALVAACAALDDAHYLERSRELNSQGMQQLEEGFKTLGLSWIPSRGNFIAVDFAQDAAPINQALLEQGVIVRPVAGYGMPNFLRVSIGTQAENQRFLDVLTQVLQQA